MLKTLLIGILSCSKKIFGAAVTCGVKLVELVTNIMTRTGDVLVEGWNWLGTSMRKPQANSMDSSGPPITSAKDIILATMKATLIHRFLLFLGGLLCVFVLPLDITNNDLTWFEGMLNSMKNMVSNTCSTIRERAVATARSMFNQKAVT